MAQDFAAAALRLATASPRRFVGAPIEWHVVQMRSAQAGWPDWIDVAESADRQRARAQLAEIAQAAAACPELGIELQVTTRLVLA